MIHFFILYNPALTVHGFIMLTLICSHPPKPQPGKKRFCVPLHLPVLKLACFSTAVISSITLVFSEHTFLSLAHTFGCRAVLLAKFEPLIMTTFCCLLFLMNVLNMDRLIINNIKHLYLYCHFCLNKVNGHIHKQKIAQLKYKFLKT